MALSAYHKRQYASIYESTRGLLAFIDDLAPEVRTAHILDAACGAGANAYHMLRRWPECRITGMDFQEALLKSASEMLPAELRPRCTYLPCDLLKLRERFSPDAFDVATLIQTLGCGQFGLDSYTEVLGALTTVAKSWIFLNALFSDHRMDVTCTIHLHVPAEDYRSGQVTYTIFCLKHFTEVCKKLGVREVISRDFEIPIDLPGPADGGLGTYTVKTADGRRLQFSGAVPMPWKFVALRLR